MMRTRLLWFTLGFASTSAIMTQFVFKDLWIDRKCISSQSNEKFSSLDSRVSNLESVLHREHTPQQGGQGMPPNDVALPRHRMFVENDGLIVPHHHPDCHVRKRAFCNHASVFL